jgi:hypothetical protein
MDDVRSSTAGVDAQVRAVLGRVTAQRRSVEIACGYLSVLSKMPVRENQAVYLAYHRRI